MLFYFIVVAIAIGVAASRSNFTAKEKIGIGVGAIALSLVAAFAAQSAFAFILTLAGVSIVEETVIPGAGVVYESTPLWLTLSGSVVGAIGGALAALGFGSLVGRWRARKLGNAAAGSQPQAD